MAMISMGGDGIMMILYGDRKKKELESKKILRMLIIGMVGIVLVQSQIIENY
jgi:hypothetical protein